MSERDVETEATPGGAELAAGGVKVLARARWAVATLFFVNGAALATWATRVPAVQQHLGLTAGQLGWALLGMATGGLPAMSLVAALVSRYGSRMVGLVASVLMCLALLLPPLAFGGVSLFVALMVLGASSGAADVAMNTQAATIEVRYARPIMASFHAFFSLGGLCGALVGAALAWLGVSTVAHLAIVAAALTLATLSTAGGLLRDDAEAASVEKAAGASLLPLWGLALITFCSVLNEGAVADWSAVYLRKVVGDSAGVAALGYAAFALAMVTGRATGDKVAERFGDRAVIAWSGVIGAVGLGLALALGGTVPAIFGFACVGLGCACVFPTMVRAATRVSRVASAAAVAMIATAGYLGFFVGPPLIGFVADRITLRGALVVVVACALAIVGLGRKVEAGGDGETGAVPRDL